MSQRALILLVEDSEDDAFFFRWSLQKSGIDCELAHVQDGAAAIEYLRGVKTGEKRRPEIVFLDLKLPTFNGFDVLNWLRQNPINPALRVIVLSGSEHTGDLTRAEELGAAGYVVKPISQTQLRDLLGVQASTQGS